MDIVVGAHRMLSKDVAFKKLGLLVIDEEQRFGVRRKERIKQYRTTADILTLSATPIPRTLNMSLIGIRDISVINTPPMDRRSVRTRLVKFGDCIIKEAISREMRRQGQIYFIHNRVESIYYIGEYLNKLLPEARVGIAHGQMPEKNLERIMFDFINGEYDVLLATTIVESGLDIPNVNTVIVNNAHQFGLSRLYQLRGRVGRSHAQAYAYLMVPGEAPLSESARKRLSVLRELTRLGSGFKIAGYDLELRGAGDLLGSKQSGHIAAIGFELYCSMVEEAVAKLAGGDQKAALEREISINLTFEAHLPDSYIRSMNHRLEAYRDISSRETEEELWEIRDSLEDRFGKPPQAAVNLFYKALIKMLASEMEITRLDQREDGLEMLFSDKFQPEPERLFAFLGKSEYNLKALPGNKLGSFARFPGPEPILGFLTTI